MAMKHCKECGHPVSTNAKCCPSCGSRKWRGSSLGKALGLVVVFVFGLAIVGAMTGGSNTPRSARADTTPRVQPAPTVQVATKPTPPPPAPPVTGDWKITSGTSQMDDSTSVTLWLDAESTIERWPGKRHRPRLFVRHQEGRLSCFIDVGGPPNVERGKISSATATLRFDDGEPESFPMPQSTDGEALFFNDPERVVRRLARTDRLVFRHTPFNSNPATVTFDLRGLTEAIVPLEDVSGWRLEK